MNLITVYLWDQDGVYSGSEVIGESLPMPAHSTPTPPPSTSGTEVACWAGAGWVVMPERPTPPIPAVTAEDIAARRYQAETAGTTVDGAQVDTGRDSQSLITGAALQATLDAAYTCRWKTAAGFVDLSATQILAMAAAVRAHVQACFDREAELLGELAAGTLTADMLEQGWP